MLKKGIYKLAGGALLRNSNAHGSLKKTTRTLLMKRL